MYPNLVIMNITLTIVIVLLKEIRFAEPDTIVTHVHIAVPDRVPHGLPLRVAPEHHEHAVYLPLFRLRVLVVDGHQEYTKLVGFIVREVAPRVDISISLVKEGR